MRPALPVLLLAVFVGACGPDDSSGAQFRATKMTYDEVLSGRIVDPADLPFRELMFGEDDWSLFDVALWQLRQPCVDAQGYREPPLRRVIGSNPGGLARRYYYVDPEQAAQSGLGPGPESAFVAELNEYDAAFDAIVAEMDYAEQERFAAVVQDCRHEAEQVLCGKGGMTEGDGYCSRMMELDGEREAESYDASRGSPAVGDAMRRWSGCMDAAGYDLSTVEEASRRESDSPPDSAKALTVADMRCKDKTRLVDVWSTVEAMIQEEMIERDPEYYSGLDEQRDALLRRAAEVLAEPMTGDGG